jgi:hypothetical protein
MWRRFRRRSMAPRRPLLFPAQIGIVMVSALCILGGLAVVVWVLVGR